LIEIVVVGNSRGQDKVFTDEVKKISNRPIIVPNDFIIFSNFARLSFGETHRQQHKLKTFTDTVLIALYF